MDAARGMGMHEAEVLFRVELPVALPLILSGLRSAAIQIVSTATIAAYVSLSAASAGTSSTGSTSATTRRWWAAPTLVALLALATLALFWGVTRLTVSRGVLRSN